MRSSPWKRPGAKKQSQLLLPRACLVKNRRRKSGGNVAQFALTADADFAYVFMSCEEAAREAGAEVAAAWRSVRETADENAALAFAGIPAEVLDDMTDLWIEASVLRPTGR